ncbi:hypothetical protein LIER_25604 [Lithospermum erythrorhizon]|uniref:Gag-pol polyprotein n=1 Tax=Lithospermum erythrorhizon TaxID=34254 RepID=A0AAV3R8F6_LITER
MEANKEGGSIMRPPLWMRKIIHIGRDCQSKNVNAPTITTKWEAAKKEEDETITTYNMRINDMANEAFALGEPMSNEKQVQCPNYIKKHTTSYYSTHSDEDEGSDGTKNFVAFTAQILEEGTVDHTEPDNISDNEEELTEEELIANYQRELVEDKIIKLEHVSTEKHVADIFTKGLDVNQFEYLRIDLGLCVMDK